MGRRPLTARSVVASTLLGVDPPRLSVTVLVGTGELFGINPGTVRTALSRMGAAGEVAASDGQYELVGRLRERQVRQEESRRPRTRPWDGSWELAVVTEDRRTADRRADLRTAMRTLHLAEVREGVWGRPDNLDPARSAGARAVRDDQCAHVTGARSAGLDAAALWDLDGWATTAHDLRREMAGLLPRLEGEDPDALAPGFVASAAVLRHFLADPLLPAELLPDDWPGAEVRAEYDAYDSTFRAAHRHWIQRLTP